jgi:hypothetical protein
LKFKRWSEDKWLSRSGSILPHDKLEHFLLGALGTFIAVYWIGFTLIISLIIWEVLGIGWETKDGLVPYDKEGNIEGFSWKDLIADNAGFLVGFALFYLIS